MVKLMIQETLILNPQGFLDVVFMHFIKLGMSGQNPIFFFFFLNKIDG